MYSSGVSYEEKKELGVVHAADSIEMLEPINESSEMKWLRQLEEKTRLLKALEEERSAARVEHDMVAEKIESIKEELAELQLSSEELNKKMKDIENKWAKSKEELAELALG